MQEDVGHAIDSLMQIHVDRKQPILNMDVLGKRLLGGGGLIILLTAILLIFPVSGTVGELIFLKVFYERFYFY